MKGNKKENLLGYEIKIIPDRESGYFAVRFPDFPGIITGGYSLEEAIKNGQEALELTIDTMKRHKVPLPKPKSRFSGHLMSGFQKISTENWRERRRRKV
jgi:predicted RNase H-like HicB family nuclease